MLASLEQLLAPEEEEEPADGGDEGGDRKKRHARRGRRGRWGRGRRGRRGGSCKLPFDILGIIEEASKEEIKMGVS